MDEAEVGCVQGLPMKTKLFQQVTMRLSGAAVNRVADERMADRRHVDPDLVRPACFQAAFDQCRILEKGQPPPMSDGPLALSFADDRDLLAVLARPGKAGVDRPLRLARNVADDRQIATVDRMLRELLRQPFMRTVVLGNDQQARRVLVDAMDDAGSGNATNP